ncbi:APC family permease [Alphaproteobacteria bacterium endosymbiont of Tiliacea citrago]|uniref:APC family permease n=1 Tax=Alphaproteobacteria bacterium endosymbiont of Tiliacea citrago TaxID=3077944 RepID=UPI00313A8373
MNEIKKMSLWQAVAMIFSGMVGSGVLFLPYKMAHCKTWGIFSWFLGAVMSYCIFLSFVGINNYIQDNIGNKTPSVLDFLRLGYNDTVAFLLIFGHFFAMSMSSAVTAISFSDYFFGLFPCYFCSKQLLSSFVLLSIFLLNILSFGAANALNFWLTLVKLLFFLLISMCGAFYYSSYSPCFETSALLFDGAAITMFAFLGIEFGIFASGSIENPKENVIKATKIGLFLSSITFIGIFASCLFILPNLEQTKTPVYDCAIILLGPIGGKIVGSVALLSCLTGLNGRVVVQGNSLQDFSKKKFVSKIFGAKTSQGFPWIGSFFSLLISFGVIWMPFKIELTLFIVVLVGFLYCAIVLSDLLLNGFSLMVLLAIMSCCLMMYNANLTVVLAAFLVYFIAYIFKIINSRFS